MKNEIIEERSWSEDLPRMLEDCKKERLKFDPTNELDNILNRITTNINDIMDLNITKAQAEILTRLVEHGSHMKEDTNSGVDEFGDPVMWEVLAPETPIVEIKADFIVYHNCLYVANLHIKE